MLSICTLTMVTGYIAALYVIWNICYNCTEIIVTTLLKYLLQLYWTICYNFTEIFVTTLLNYLFQFYWTICFNFTEIFVTTLLKYLLRLYWNICYNFTETFVTTLHVVLSPHKCNKVIYYLNLLQDTDFSACSLGGKDVRMQTIVL